MELLIIQQRHIKIIQILRKKKEEMIRTRF